MSFTGGTILPVLPNHNPNEGRTIINDNFQKIIGEINDAFGISGGTKVQSGVNIYTGGTA